MRHGCAASKCGCRSARSSFQGVLCNLLVCLAVWLAMAGRTVTDKVLAIVFPITTFVAGGFEHSVANRYFIPLKMFLRESVSSSGMTNLVVLSWLGLARNLLPVTPGNLVGGAGMVGLVYGVIHRRETVGTASNSPPK